MKKFKVTEKSLINYTILSFFGLCFVISTLLDPCNDDKLYQKITIIKIFFGLLIVFWILLKFYIEITRLIKRFRINYGMIKNYDWFLRFENLWTFIKTILLITPFLALNIYWALSVMNSIEDFEVFSLELAKSFSGDFLNKFGFFTNQKVFLFGATIIWAMFLSLFFATVFYIGYKIAMKRFTNNLIRINEKISNNCKKTKEYKDMLGDNLKELEEEKANIDKANFFIREVIVFTYVKFKISEMWKDVKKGTLPPRK
ncbi:hypothetical protein SCORR_v1c04400 [Spiroplasma corruscae]|uniref:Transmembrane protein n=1 Tax=Spiroplasma corruscae TaxID=216934 RepID=A0A222EPM0_9MOLU|nr:hypothetical protein [Spiroplasma corruscae]ASP28214.1 hypothetical protein SCORR_v1c04400 [Spiroplasma corruscae]